MRVVVRSAGSNDPGARSHYCHAAHETIGLCVEGLPDRAQIFCPMCGALAPWDRDNHLYDGLPRLNDYDGPLCRHGRPDVTCVELAAADDDLAYRLNLTYAVSEYPAAALAARYACATTLIQWVRYCPECRNEFARAHFPILQNELELLRGRLADESRQTQHTLMSMSQDVCDLSGAARALSEVVGAITEQDVSPLGFVYLIGHDSAFKIGWSEKHPEKGRLAQLQTASDKSLELFGFMLGTVADERRVHRRFSQHHIRGEWFQPAQEIVAYFQENYPVDGRA